MVMFYCLRNIEVVMCLGIFQVLTHILNHTYKVKVIVSYLNHDVGSPANGALHTYSMTFFKPIGRH
jgi:hypothetical protein